MDANWAAPNSATVGLNRPFAGVGGQTVTVNLIEPGTFHGDRVNQIDLRLAKILRFGRTRTNVGFDIYNITNAAPVLTYNETFIPGQAVLDLVDADLGAAAAFRQSSARRSISDATKTEVDTPVGSDHSFASPEGPLSQEGGPSWLRGDVGRRAGRVPQHGERQRGAGRDD